MLFCHDAPHIINFNVLFQDSIDDGDASFFDKAINWDLLFGQSNFSTPKQKEQHTENQNELDVSIEFRCFTRFIAEYTDHIDIF